MKSSGKFLFAFALIFLVLFMIEYNQDEPVDWSPGFNQTAKKPFGNYLLFETLAEIYKDQTITTIKSSVVDHLNELNYPSSGVNYIFINDYIEFNDFETNALLDFVKQGNNVFIASNNITDTLINSLRLKERSLYEGDYFYSMKDSLFRFNFCDNIKSVDSGYSILNEYYALETYLDSMEGNRKILAADADGRCILSEIKYGKGKFILCTLPYAFTNYYILKPANADFIFKTLGRLPLQEVWWDEHYKSGKNTDTPLRYILDKRSLRWAYYLSITALILFVIFMGKRRQRVIPIQDPMKNASLEFAETVGQVYYEKGDHRNLALKKIKYFSEFVRTKYTINVGQELNRNRKEFLENLSDKSGRPLNEIKVLYEYIIYIENTDSINEKELIYLNTLIENFKTIHSPGIK